MTKYTKKELQAIAVTAIREDAKSANVKAHCTGWALFVTNQGATLQAIGTRTDKPLTFTVNVAI
jgi:hypothetical protein